MDSFAALKRRTTDLLQNIPHSLPSIKPQSHDNGVVKATWERINVPPLPRSSHSIDIVAGTAYIFGGETKPREPVDNDMHCITLPFSSADADYYPIKAKADKQPPAEPPKQQPAIPEVVDEKPEEKDLDDVPLASPSPAAPAETTASEPEPALSKGKEPAEAAEPNYSSLGDVPAPRVGHATAVIGHRIFMFGGRGGPDMQPLEEFGRVWVFDTRTHTWTYLDPLPPATAAPAGSPSAVTKPRYPAARSYHSAVATDKPRHPELKPVRRTESWKEWAQGDSDVVGTPQRPIVGNIAAGATDEDSDGYGTFIVHGGCFVQGRASDVWAFDVRSRVWQELPNAPGKPRGGTAIAIAKSRLYRFGGFNGEGEEGGQLDYLELVIDSFNDASGRGEVCIGARGGWKSLLREEDASATEGEKSDDAAAAVPLTGPPPEWPGNRSVAGLEAVTAGGGREYLVLLLGERDPSNAGHAAAGKFWDDVWAFQVPLHGHDHTAASVSDKVRGVFGAGGRSGEGRWFRVEAEAYDDEDDEEAGRGPGPRGWIATAAMGELEERGVVVWGGLDSENKRLGDGWILRLGSEKREP
ncbi:Nitrile-specifier protein 5 [Pleurostoma richardsiae]|uniref:Nitrile-specifier protein 5 n=1 Tax=Pleurostoma richardsiae TaxID=41990 RepID=A0AA38RT31_9PEZI|nr:Nitrile-specifier protein 5 [Pleurostoma richardsiae]